MFTGLIARLALKTGFPQKVLGPLIVGAGALLIAGVLLLGWHLWLSHHDKTVVEQHDTARDNRILKKEVPAIQHSADQRAADTTTVQQQREELRHADEAPPSGDGLTPRQRRGCIVLRQQGARLADHPPCERLKS